MRKPQAQCLFVALLISALAAAHLPSASALDRDPSSSLGISVSGQMPSVAGAFAPVLNPQLGGALGVDIAAPLLEGRSRLFVSAGLQNYAVEDSSLLSLSTFEFLAGLSFRSEPYVWLLEPTLNVGLGATLGTLQIDGVTSETQNSAAYFTTLVSPGSSSRLFGGLSLGIEMPVRVIFSQYRVTTLSPALTLRYEL